MQIGLKFRIQSQSIWMHNTGCCRCAEQVSGPVPAGPARAQDGQHEEPGLRRGEQNLPGLREALPPPRHLGGDRALEQG